MEALTPERQWQWQVRTPQSDQSDPRLRHGSLFLEQNRRGLAVCRLCSAVGSGEEIFQHVVTQHQKEEEEEEEEEEEAPVSSRGPSQSSGTTGNTASPPHPARRGGRENLREAVNILQTMFSSRKKADRSEKKKKKRRNARHRRHRRKGSLLLSEPEDCEDSQPGSTSGSGEVQLSRRCPYCGLKVPARAEAQHIRTQHRHLTFSCRLCTEETRYLYVNLRDVLTHQR